MKKTIKITFVIFLLCFQAAVIYSSNAVTLETLPPEMTELIINLLPIEDRISLKSTCHSFDTFRLDGKFLKEDRECIKNSPLYDRIKYYVQNKKEFLIDSQASYLFSIAQNVLIQHYFFTNDNLLNCKKNSHIRNYYKENFKLNISENKTVENIVCHFLKKNNKRERVYVGIDCAGLYQKEVDNFTPVLKKIKKKSISAYLFDSDYANKTLTEENNNIFLKNICSLIENLNKTSLVKKITIDHIIGSLFVDGRPLCCYKSFFKLVLGNKKINEKSMSRKGFQILLENKDTNIVVHIINDVVQTNINFLDDNISYGSRLINSLKKLIQENSFLKHYDYSLYDDLFYHIFCINEFNFDFLGQDNIQYYIQYCETNSGLSFKRYCKKKFKLPTDNIQLKKIKDRFVNIKNEKSSLKNKFIKNYCFPKILLLSDQSRYFIPSISKYIQDNGKNITKLNNTMDTLESQVKTLKNEITKQNNLNGEKSENIAFQNKTLENFKQREDDLRKKIGQLEDQIKNQGKLLDDFNKKESNLCQEIKTLKNEINNHQTNLNNLHEADNEKYKNLDNLNTLLSDKKQELEQQNKKLADEISNQKNTIALYENEKTNLDKKLLDAKEILTEIKEKLLNSEEKINQISNLVIQQEQEILNLQNENKAKTEIIKKHELENNGQTINKHSSKLSFANIVILLLSLYSGLITYYLYKNINIPKESPI